MECQHNKCGKPTQSEYHPFCFECYEKVMARLNNLPDWIIRKLKTLSEYSAPTDGRDAKSEIQGWMHVLCFHYEQNLREVKEYDAARRRAKELEAEVVRLREMLWVNALCGACGKTKRYNRADDPKGEKADAAHAAMKLGQCGEPIGHK